MNTVKQLNEGMGRTVVAETPKKLSKTQRLEAELAAMKAQLAALTATPAPQTTNQTASAPASGVEIAVLVNGQVAAQGVGVIKRKDDGRQQAGLYGLRLSLAPDALVSLRVNGQTFGPAALRPNKAGDNWIFYAGGKTILGGKNAQAGLNLSLSGGKGAGSPRPDVPAVYCGSINVTEWHAK